MKYAVKLFSQTPNLEGAPADWPAIVMELDDAAETPVGYTAMTQEQLDAQRVAHQAEFDIWANGAPSTSFRLKLRDLIDDKTNELIDAGFTYQTMSFKLDLEHQNSYMFDYLLNQSYPHTVKGVGEDYLTFTDRNEHTAFIGTGFSTVDAVIRGGWDLKDGLDELTYAQLIAWTDPRT